MKDYTEMTREEARKYLNKLENLAYVDDRDTDWLYEVMDEVGEVNDMYEDDDGNLVVEPGAYTEADTKLGYLIDAIDEYIEFYEDKRDLDEELMREYRRSV